LLTVVRRVEVGSSSLQQTTEFVGEIWRAIHHEHVIKDFIEHHGAIGKKSSDSVAHLVSRAGADGVQQRLAGAVARRRVEGAVALDEAQQSRPMLLETAKIANSAADAIEALKKGRT
jgi:hypothetical protein